MWFKNLQIYRLPAPWNINLADFEDQLARGEFVKCTANQPTSRGWVSPRNDGALVYANNHQWLIALAVEQRLLPSSVVNETAQERAEQIADQQGYQPGRKQMKEIKERVIEELMPRAFTRKRTTYVWIDPANGWLVIDASSPAKADEVIEHLRNCLDEFPLKALHTQLSPQSAMADWLAGGEAPAGFSIDQDCELKAISEEKSAVRYTRHPLEGETHDEVKAHLAAGKLPTRLALTWDDRVSFVLTEKLEIKRLAFLDIVKEAAEKDAETAGDLFDADFVLMTGELSRLLPSVVDAMGGEVIDLNDQGGGAPASSNNDITEAEYTAALQVVTEAQRASISLIQRHLRIGFNRAARLLEEMEKRGVVSPPDHEGKRTLTDANT